MDEKAKVIVAVTVVFAIAIGGLIVYKVATREKPKSDSVVAIQQAHGVTKEIEQGGAGGGGASTVQSSNETVEDVEGQAPVVAESSEMSAGSEELEVVDKEIDDTQQEVTEESGITVDIPTIGKKGQGSGSSVKEYNAQYGGVSSTVNLYREVSSGSTNVVFTNESKDRFQKWIVKDGEGKEVFSTKMLESGASDKHNFKRELKSAYEEYSVEIQEYAKSDGDCINTVSGKLGVSRKD